MTQGILSRSRKSGLTAIASEVADDVNEIDETTPTQNVIFSLKCFYLWETHNLFIFLQFFPIVKRRCGRYGQRSVISTRAAR